MSASEMPVDRIIVGERARQDLGDVSELAESIRDVGLLHPPVVRSTDEGAVLVAGARRIAAWKQLGYGKIPVTIAFSILDEVSALSAERDENTCRKDFKVSESVALADSIEQRIAAAAKDRQREHAGTSPGCPADTSSKLEEVSDSRTGRQTDTKVAAAVGMGKTTLAKARAVVEASNDESLPEPVRKVAERAVSDMDATGKVDPAFRQVESAKTFHSDDHQAIENYLAGDPDIELAKWRVAFGRAQGRMTEVLRFDDSHVVDRLLPDDIEGLERGIDLLTRWLERIKKERSPLRIVKDGAS
ncbi:MAG: ParB/RepB/Spo0J family partition protein [Marinosulfonomonas sp.]|nr:ParB/RepB/Spo0J family partition protein [Marinosulfonomonas sp.]